MDYAYKAKQIGPIIYGLSIGDKLKLTGSATVEATAEIENAENGIANWKAVSFNSDGESYVTAQNAAVRVTATTDCTLTVTEGTERELMEYRLGSDVTSPGKSVSAVVDPVTGGLKVRTPNGATTAFPAHHIEQLKTSLGQPRIFDSAVMSSPPAFSESADFAGGSIAGGVFVSLADSRLFKPTPLAVAYATQGRNVYNPAPGCCTGLSFSFGTDAQVFELDLQTGAAGIPTLLIVDGQFASATMYNGTPPGSGNIRRQWKFSFASKKLRQIQVITSGVHNGMAGIFVGPNDQVVAWNPGITGGALVIADSYGGSPFGAVPSGGPAVSIIDACKYGAAVAQFGGSGYYSTNGANNYLSRLQSWVSAAGAAPAVLLTMGGINDTIDPSQTKSAIDAYYSYCAANVPSALHIVTGPWCPKQSYINGADKYTLINGWLKAALQSSGLQFWVFLDTLNGGWVTSWGTSGQGVAPWITGSGYVGGATGNGNADFYIGSDQTHPSTAGVEYFHRRLAADVAQALQTYR